MLNHVQPGNVLTFTATEALKSGDGILLGSAGLFGISHHDVKPGEQGEAIIVEVWTLPKASADTPAQFAAAYWDDANKRVTTTTEGNTKIGYFTEAYGAGSVQANVLLRP